VLLRFGWESLETILAEPNIRELLTAYWTELSPIKHVPLDIDWPQKAALEKAGRYRIWACRADGTLAGFIAWHVTPHLNHRTTLCAFTDVHYLAPAFRDNRQLGWRMWRTAEPALKKLGVKAVFPHDDHAKHLLPFFLALGYAPAMTVYMKVLDE